MQGMQQEWERQVSSCTQHAVNVVRYMRSRTAFTVCKLQTSGMLCLLHHSSQRPAVLSGRRNKGLSPVCCATAKHSVAESQLLSDVNVVLVSPKHAANIGSVARAAENFEVSRLFIVDPRCDPQEGEAYKLACGSPLLDSLTVVSNLEEALAPCSASIGFTRRAGNTRLVHASLHHLLQSFPYLLSSATDAPITCSVAQASNNICSTPVQNKGNNSSSTVSNDSDSNVATSSERNAQKQSVTAIVFGREESGLTEAELSLCTHSCSIPSGSVQPSLNLSHAVCVVLAQLFQHRSLGSTGLSTPTLQTLPKHHQPASNDDISMLVQRWTDLAAAAGLGSEMSVGGTGSHGRKRRTAGHLQAVISRAQVTEQELRALHGLCSALLHKVQQAND